MERLTFEGNFCDIAKCAYRVCPYDHNCTQKQVWERLKAYEDAGLSPQACTEAREIEETLSGCDYSISRMVELMRADKDGRVLILPCKVGDVLYAAESPPVIPLHVMEVAIYLALEGEDGGDYERISNIGKTVFLTREEAEKAMEVSE